MSAVKNKQGNTHTDKIEVLKCWEEHFSAHLNTAFPHPNCNRRNTRLPEEADDLPPIFLDKIEQAFKKMKNRKAPDIDSIKAEVLKADGNPMTEIIHKIFNAIWVLEKTPKDLARMLVTLIYG